MATLPKSDFLQFQSVMLIDQSSSELYATEQTLLIGADIRQIHKERDPIQALEMLKNAKAPQDLPQIIFLDIKNSTPNSFVFLEEFTRLPQWIRDNTRVVLMSIYFQFKTELDYRIAKYSFVTDQVTKPLDIRQLYRLQPAC
ncbi:MAG: hypothetical protein ACFB10_14350 [Salibacteraceae bacterium]|mgnify:CR=1 FL=1